MSRFSEAIKVLAFVVVLGTLTAAVGVTMADTRFDAQDMFTAEFSDLSGLEEGVEVRAAGVNVGQVGDISLQPDKSVEVNFSVAKTVPLTDQTYARIRYKNLTGDRFLELSQSPGSGNPLPAGGEIPLQRTSPALDLDALFHGFKPLMKGLSPDQFNKLSSSLISVFQGQSGAVEGLLSQVGSFTSSLADRDKLIGDLINNLNTALSTVDEQKGQFSELVSNLQKVVSGLASDRKEIGSSLERTNQLASTATGFLKALRPELQGAVEQTGRVAGALNQDPQIVDYALGQVPDLIQLTSRGGAYGSFFNFYLCGLQVKITGPTGDPMRLPRLYDNSTPRCAFPGGQR